MQVNYRYFHKVSNDQFDAVVADLRAGRQPSTEGRPVHIPSHGTLAEVRQSIPAEKAAGPADPVGGSQPVWLTDQPALRSDGASA
jgi:hypothetical protein